MNLPQLHRITGEFALMDSASKELFPLSQAAIDEICRRSNAHDAISARLFHGDAFARSFLKWAEQMRSVGRTLPGMEARENEARAFLTKAEGEP